MPLPRRLAADEHRRRAFLIEAERRPLVAVAAAGIDVEDEPDAPQMCPLPRTRLSPARGLPAARLARLLQDGSKIAGVVGLPERCAVGHGAFGNEIPAAQLGGVEAEVVRRPVDQALQQVDVLRPAGAAVGIGRRGVGVGGADPHVERRCPVRADQRAGATGGRDERPEVGRIGAEVGDAVDGKREKPPVAVERESRPRAQVAALMVARHGLAPLRHPLDRTAEHAGGEQRERIFGIDPELDSEGAADIGRHHAEPPGGNLQHVPGQDVPHQMDALRAGGERVDAAPRIVGAERGAGLHGAADDALVVGLDAHPVGRPAERVLHRRAVAQLPVHAAIARRFGVKLGRVGLQRGLCIGDCRERPIGDGNGLGRCLGLGGALGNHEGNRVAHHAHPPGREHRAGRQGGGATVGTFGRHHAGDRPDAGTGQIGGGEDGAHPRHRCRSACIDQAELGMGVGRAHDAAPCLTGEHDIVDIAPAAGEEALVLRSPLRRTDALCHPTPALPSLRAHVR